MSFLPMLMARRRCTTSTWRSLPNELFVLFGPSRAGKTTLLRLFNRLSDLIEGTQRQGEVLLHGRDVFAPGTNVSALRRRVSMVFALPTPLPGSIYANLTYGLKMAGLRDRSGAGCSVSSAHSARPPCGMR